MKTFLLLTCIISFAIGNCWRCPPGGIFVETTTKHDLGFERDTVRVKHWHKSGNKFYIITTDGFDLWVDNVKQIKKGVANGNSSKRR